jgi:hypothetical protein
MAALRVEGTVVIACNCDWGCPCNFNAPPTKGNCQGGWTWVIDTGSYEDVSLDGLAVSVFCEWPGAIHEGNGRAIAFIDERATPQQRNTLGRLVRGELGGPWQIFINTYSLAEPKPARFEINLTEHATSLRVGDAAQIELQPIRNPVTGDEAHPELLLPEALVVNHQFMATSKTFRLDDALSYDHSGQNAAFGRFTYELS